MNRLPPVSRKLSWMVAPPLGHALGLMARDPWCLAPRNWLKVSGCLLRGALASAVNACAPTRPTSPGIPPVFVVGFWRSGTTLLQELLCQDPKVCYPRSYDCMAPGHAHWTSPRVLPVARERFASRRAMDNMVIRLDSPQEDEFFLLNDCARSFYELFVLPGEGRGHLSALDPSRWSPSDRARWGASMDALLGCLTRTGADRAVLKSPTHTFRAPLLKARYPGAVFLHLRRDPVAVFLSTRHMWRANVRIYALHAGRRRLDLDGLVAETYRQYREAAEGARRHLGKDWYDLDYEELVGDPQACLERIYRHFGWPAFEAVAPAAAAYREARKDYRTNDFRMEGAERARLLRELGE